MCFHWAMNRIRDRLAICLTVYSESGIVTTATSASSGEMMIIMISTPTMLKIDVSIWLRVCCRLCETLSMSLVTRLSRSPRD